ncbi:MAG: hypothetical protein HY826_08110 [Actinobacteria bacterium]|nr:hypothetical protein [Actinomycetota bacterium]
MASSALAACGDDDKGSDSATHEEWFQAACATIGGDQSGFPEFTEAHPDGASVAEWAEFLPTPIEFLDRIIAAARLPHPSEDDAGTVATIAAVEKLQATWQAAIDAASAGDDAGFDAAMGQGDADFAAMDAALKAVDPRDCPGFSS